MKFSNKIAFFILLAASFLVTTILPGTVSAKSKPDKTATTSEESKENDLQTLKQLLLKAYNEKKFATALSYCEKAIILAPNDADLIFSCANIAQRANQDIKALELSNYLVSIDKDNLKKFDLCFFNAISYTKLHQWDNAINNYQNCPYTDTSAIALSNTAELYMIKGDLEKAQDGYLRSLQKSSLNLHAIFGYTVALTRAGNEDLARKVFFWGLSEDPTISFLEDAFFEPDGELYFHKAVFAYYLGQKANAIAFLKAYLKTEQPQYHLDTAQKLLDKISQKDEFRVDVIPMPETFVESIAVDPELHYLVLATKLGRLAAVDLKTMSARELTNAQATIIDLGFTDNHKLRVLTSRNLLEIDLSDPAPIIYKAPIRDATFALGFANTAQDILYYSPDENVYKLKIADYDQNTPLYPNISPQDEARRETDDESMSFLKRSTAETKSSKRVRDTSLFGSVNFNPPRAALSPDNLRLLLTQTIPFFGRPVIIDLPEKNPSGSVQPYFNFAHGIAAHPTLPIFAIATDKGTFVVNTEGDILFSVPGAGKRSFSAVYFDNSGRYLVTAGEVSAEIWDLHAVTIPDKIYKDEILNTNGAQ